MFVIVAREEGGQGVLVMCVWRCFLRREMWAAMAEPQWYFMEGRRWEERYKIVTPRLRCIICASSCPIMEEAGGTPPQDTSMADKQPAQGGVVAPATIPRRHDG